MTELGVGGSNIGLISRTARLGEGPVYDDASECIYWVDIDSGLLLGTDAASLETTVVWAAADRVTSVALTSRGTLLVSLSSSVVELKDDSSVHVVAALPSLPHGTRLNDCGVDPGGGYWIGTLNHQGVRSSGLYKLSATGRLELAADGMMIANGMDWSLCGQWMYFVDSGTRVVTRVAFDPTRGELVRRYCDRKVIDRWAGEPDGLWVDAEGAIWVAVWDASLILRFQNWSDESPEVVPVPGSRPTSGAFFGRGLDSLFVTMAGADREAVPACVLAGLGPGRLPSRVRLF